MDRTRITFTSLVAACAFALMATACGPTTIDLPSPSPRASLVPPSPALSLSPAAIEAEPPIPSIEGPNDLAFVGLGTWVDIFESAYRHPARSVARMRALGVRTIYLQTSNFTRPAIRFPGRLGAFIDAAHASDMRVIGWYLPGLKDLPADLAKSLAAIRYTSPNGDSLDGFGVDIEAAEVRRHKLRSQRLVMHSRQLRQAVGPDYPLAAITPMPVRLAQPVTYWRDFPYQDLTPYYDAILPMNYFTYDAKGEAGVERYTARGIQLIRLGTGDPAYPIHVIGGISGDMTTAEARGFMRAVGEGGATGWSLYNYSLTPRRLWPVISAPPTMGGSSSASSPA